MRKIKVVQFGLGPIGIESVKLAATQSTFEVVGGIDIDPAKVGRTLAEITGGGNFGAARVFSSLAELLKESPPDIILHTASSSAAATLAQMRPALDRGLSVVSTCEELIFPRLKSAALADEYDALCQKSGGRIVAAGVNPGFVMDLLPIALTGVSRQVSSICVERVVDASTRRQPLQAKIGSGQVPADFTAKFREGRAGHAGLQESAALVAHAMGWKLDRLTETCEPVVAQARIVTDFFDVSPGQSCGIHQRCVGLAGGEERLVLDLQMYLRAPNPHDTIFVRGRPQLNLTVHGGVAGDDATVAAVINTVPRILAAKPGVRLVTELPAAAWLNPQAS